jgi:hypothetical protein
LVLAQTSLDLRQRVIAAQHPRGNFGFGLEFVEVPAKAILSSRSFADQVIAMV